MYTGCESYRENWIACIVALRRILAFSLVSSPDFYRLVQVVSVSWVNPQYSMFPNLSIFQCAKYLYDVNSCLFKEKYLQEVCDFNTRNTRNQVTSTINRLTVANNCCALKWTMKIRKTDFFFYKLWWYATIINHTLGPNMKKSRNYVNLI